MQAQQRDYLEHVVERTQTTYTHAYCANIRRQYLRLGPIRLKLALKQLEQPQQLKL